MYQIAHIITGLNNGGAETMLLKLLSGMDKKMFSSCVISLTGGGVMAERFESIGIPVLTCDMQPGRSNLANFFTLIRHLRRVKPDVVQTWLYHSDFLGGIAARLLGHSRVVWNIRHNNLDPDKNKSHTLWTVRINAILSRWVPETIICNSGNSADVHQSIGFDHSRFTIIPNGFDVQQFKPDASARREVREELSIPDETPLVGLIARFDAQKNHQGFIEAASLIANQHPNARFVLAGTDASWDTHALSSWIDARGLRGRMFLLGRRDDIYRITASLDVAVSTSWGEGFPNAVGEAMASGVPCVVTDVGDCSFIVGDTGYVVQAGQMSALAQQVCVLLDMPKHARAELGARARQRIVDRFLLHDIIHQYEQLYISLLDKEQR